MLESRDGSENLDTQVIYGMRYVDEIVRFEKDGQGTMFAFQDANWNVTSTVNYAAVPLDRIYTTPYGEPTFDAETINGDYDGDGDIDSGDNSAFDSCNLASDPPTGACRVFDFDNDEDIDSADNTVFDTLYTGSTAIYRQPARRTSANGFPFAHQGLALDQETLTYYNRERQYDPWQKRFKQRDPLTKSASAGAGFQDGVNVYQNARANPNVFVDPGGTHVASIQTTSRRITMHQRLTYWGRGATDANVANFTQGYIDAWNQSGKIRQAGQTICQCRSVRYTLETETLRAPSSGWNGACDIMLHNNLLFNFGGNCAEDAQEHFAEGVSVWLYSQSRREEGGAFQYVGMAAAEYGNPAVTDISGRKLYVNANPEEASNTWMNMGVAHEMGHIMRERHCNLGSDATAACHGDHLMWGSETTGPRDGGAGLHNVRASVRKHAGRQAWVSCNRSGPPGCSDVDDCRFPEDPGCPQ